MDSYMEEQVMQLIINGGDARSKAVEAMRKLKTNDFEGARALMKEGQESIVIAHNIQTALLQNEAGGNGGEVQLLMVHAQDHLMDAMVMRDVVSNLIDIMENQYNLIQSIKEGGSRE